MSERWSERTCTCTAWPQRLPLHKRNGTQTIVASTLCKLCSNRLYLLLAKAEVGRGVANGYSRFHRSSCRRSGIGLLDVVDLQIQESVLLYALYAILWGYKDPVQLPQRLGSCWVLCDRARGEICWCAERILKLGGSKTNFGTLELVIGIWEVISFGAAKKNLFFTAGKVRIDSAVMRACCILYVACLAA